MNALQDLYSLTEDSQDDAKLWAFGICTVLTYYGEVVPDEWDFQPAADNTPTEWPDCEIAEIYAAGYVSTDDMIAFGHEMMAKGWPCEHPTEYRNYTSQDDIADGASARRTWCTKCGEEIE